MNLLPVSTPGVETGIEEFQKDLDNWIEEYNNKRPHSGKYCLGRTSMQTFLDSLPFG